MSVMLDSPLALERKRRQIARDVQHFATDIKTPVVLTTLPYVMKANARIGVSFSAAVTAGQLTVSVNGRVHPIPALAINQVFRLDWFERARSVVIDCAVVGVATLYVYDEWMHPKKIASTNTWKPSALGSKLLAWFDVSRPGCVTKSGNLATAIKDLVTGFTLTQLTGGSQPIVNGNWLTFDGIDDTLPSSAVNPVTWPNSTAFEIYNLGRQSAPTSNLSVVDAWAWGGGGAGNTVQLVRRVAGGINRARGASANGTIGVNVDELATDFSGRFVSHIVDDGTNVSMDINGNILVSAALAGIGINSVRMRIGAGAGAGPGAFWVGDFSALLICSPLTAGERILVSSYLNGIV